MNLYRKDDRPKVRINTEKTVGLGSIWGYTGTSFGTWGFSPVYFVKVEAGGKSTISSPIMCMYKIRNLPLGTHTITGTKSGYETFTDTVKLTERYPDKQVFVHMEPIDKSVNKARIHAYINNEEANCFGNIYGKTVGSFEHASLILPFVKYKLK